MKAKKVMATLFLCLSLPLLAADPDSTERQRAMDCAALTLEFEQLPGKIAAAQKDFKTRQTVFEGYRRGGRDNAPEDVRAKYLGAKFTLEKLEKRREELKRSLPKDCGSLTLFVESHLNQACGKLGNPSQGICGERDKLKNQGRLVAGVRDILKRWKASPWSLKKNRIQYQPGKSWALEVWHTNLLLGNYRASASLLSVPYTKADNPALFQKIYPVAKSMGFKPKADRLMFPVIIIQVDHTGPFWDEERVGVFLAKKGVQPKPLRVMPAAKPDQPIVTVIMISDLKDWENLKNGHQLFLSAMAADRSHNLNFPFPFQGMKEAVEDEFGKIAAGTTTLQAITKAERQAEWDQDMRDVLEWLGKSSG